jgi:hypothetical protein
MEFIGDINEAGVLKNLKRKGCSDSQAIRELNDNSVDAKSENILYNVERDFISIVDDGEGMNYEEVKNMFSLNRENNYNKKTIGVSGIGVKTSTLKLSKDKYVIIYTNKDGSYIKCYVPWNKMLKEGKFSGMINLIDMDEHEIKEFNEQRIRNFDNSINRGTTIKFPYNDDLANILSSYFTCTNHEQIKYLDYPGVLYPNSKVNFFYNHYERPNNTLKLKTYNYFEGENSEFYCGKFNYTIRVYSDNQIGNLQFVLEDDDDEYEGESKLKYFKKSSKNVDKDVKTFAYNRKTNEHICDMNLTCAMKVNLDFFNPKNPKKPLVGDYKQEIKSVLPILDLTNINGETLIVRNGQIPGSFDPFDNKTISSSWRADWESLIIGRGIESKLEYNIESSQSNELDLHIGIQETKGQYNKIDYPPKNLKRIVSYCRKKTQDKICHYIKSLIEEETKVNDNEEVNHDEEVNDQEEVNHDEVKHDEEVNDQEVNDQEEVKHEEEVNSNEDLNHDEEVNDQEEVNHDEVKHDEVKHEEEVNDQEEVKHEEVKHDEVKHEEVNDQEEVKHDEVKHEEDKHEEVNDHEEVNRDEEVGLEKEEFTNENLNICDIKKFIVFADSINLKSKSTYYKNMFSVLVKEYLGI